MYQFDRWAEYLQLQKQQPSFTVTVNEHSILMNSQDYRLNVYGWPDNRVTFSDKLSGINWIRRYGPKRGRECSKLWLKTLEELGFDTTAVKHWPESRSE
jgi:hypothetical protein